MPAQPGYVGVMPRLAVPLIVLLLAGCTPAVDEPTVAPTSTTVVAETPRLSNEAQRLAGEHPVLLDEIETVMGKVKGAVLRDTTATGELREQILVLLGDLSRHRSAGSDFVWDAYAIDIGGGG